jgi:predicted phosphatase
MQVIENESVIVCDVDNTLLMWDHTYKIPSEYKLKIIDPYDNSINYLKPHTKHVELLRKYKGRGMTIVVWSAAGYKWALEAVKALELEDIVDYVQTKPTKWIDDSDANSVLGSHIYLKDE